MPDKKVPARFYATDAGHEPVREWLRELSVSDRKAIGAAIGDVEFGWPIGMPVCRSLGEGLWEIRAHLSDKTIARVLFVFHAGEVVLLHVSSRRRGRPPRRIWTWREVGRQMSKVNKHIGSTFESFLEAEGLKEEVYNGAAKRVLAWQIGAAMKDAKITKTEMARRMETSRAQLDRLLDPENGKVQLDTIEKAARAIGRKLVIELA